MWYPSSLHLRITFSLSCSSSYNTDGHHVVVVNYSTTQTRVGVVVDYRDTVSAYTIRMTIFYFEEKNIYYKINQKVNLNTFEICVSAID